MGGVRGLKFYFFCNNSLQKFVFCDLYFLEKMLPFMRAVSMADWLIICCKNALVRVTSCHHQKLTLVPVEIDSFILAQRNISARNIVFPEQERGRYILKVMHELPLNVWKVGFLILSSVVKTIHIVSFSIWYLRHVLLSDWWIYSTMMLIFTTSFSDAGPVEANRLDTFFFFVSEYNHRCVFCLG